MQLIADQTVDRTMFNWYIANLGIERRTDDWKRILSNYLPHMINTLIKLKFLKFTLIGAFCGGVVATLIAKEIRMKKKTEVMDD